MSGEGTPAKVADIELVLSSRRSLSVGSGGIERWTIHAVLSGSSDTGSTTAVRVGRLQVLVIDLVKCRDPWGELDTSNEDIAHIGETVFDMNTGQLAERFDTRLERIGQRVLVLDYVELEPEWQGHNLAALLVAESLDQLRADCRVALCLPGPLERRPDLAGEEYDEALRRMQGVWSRVGFRPFEEGVWFLDPNRGTLDGSLAALREEHGLEQRR